MDENSVEWSVFKAKGEVFDAQMRFKRALFMLEQMGQHLEKATNALNEAQARLKNDKKH